MVCLRISVAAYPPTVGSGSSDHPGAANAGVPDANTANVLIYVLRNWAGGGSPAQAPKFTAAVVGTLRAVRLDDVAAPQVDRVAVRAPCTPARNLQSRLCLTYPSPKMFLARCGVTERPRVSRKWKRASPLTPDVGMLAVDTNLIVRYLTGDHPKQSAKARAVIDGDNVFVSTTVVLETDAFVTFDQRLIRAAKAADVRHLRSP